MEHNDTNNGNDNDNDRCGEPLVKLIVAVCKGGGIGINGKLPWKISDDLKYFSKLTSGDYGKYMRDTEKYINMDKPSAKICKEELNIKKNVIIMGKNTWLSLPNYPKPLPYRDSIILSTTINNNDNTYPEYCQPGYNHDLNIHFSSISHAMRFCHSSLEEDEGMNPDLYRSEKSVERNARENMINSFRKRYNEIWIIGGEKIYKSIIDMNSTITNSTITNSPINMLIDEFYITYIDKEYNCDTFFPLIENMNLYSLESIETKVCKCEDHDGISYVNVYYLVFKTVNKHYNIIIDGMMNINPLIATEENIELIKKLKIGIWNTP
jgi:dihydrofolate reductase